MSEPWPARFAALESYAGAWALQDADARLRKRMRSSMAELETFYQAVLPHLEAALLYLDEFEFGKLPTAQRRLHWLTLACAEAALSVEIYRAPTLPMAPEISRFQIVHTNMDD
jgi:hypothetical protein